MCKGNQDAKVIQSTFITNVQVIIFTLVFTFEIIKTPIILPDTNQFVDKTVIEQILINNPINPFTGLTLTIEQLEKYKTMQTQMRAGGPRN
jgi:hypothetical protein